MTRSAPAGSLVYIPAFLPHQEINPSPETVSEWVIIRNGQEAIVVNLEGKGFHHADIPGVEKIVFSLR